MQQGDHRKECCKPESGNLSEPEKYMGRDDLTFRRCSVCQCRHFEAKGDPGRLGMRGAQIG